MSAVVHLKYELDVATELAREACQAILRVRDEARNNPDFKADGQGPVTAADLAADGIIAQGLREAFPRDTLVTEETWDLHTPLHEVERAWFVDPLDGTEDFIAGLDDYVVQIGLTVRGKPVLGVVMQPTTGIFWCGVVDGDMRYATRTDATGEHVVDVAQQSFSAPLRAVVSRSHPSAAVDAIVKRVGAVSLPMGSVGLKIGCIVDGKADVYVTTSRKIKGWDTCAPVAIAHAAGAVATDIYGNSLDYVGLVTHQHGLVVHTRDAAQALQGLPDILEQYLHVRG